MQQAVGNFRACVIGGDANANQSFVQIKSVPQGDAPVALYLGGVADDE